MENLHFSIEINAPKEKVWDTMLGDRTYREWTTVFSPGSYYEGDWEKGSKILFLGPDEDGKLSGMTSVIAENRPYEFISIKHLGEVKNGVEDTTSKEVLAWAGALENYTFVEKDGQTEVQVDMIGNDQAEETKQSKEMTEMFKDMWPKALQKLKELAER
jgi:uncharacterized protein YndB with AHSA1/START domain